MPHSTLPDHPDLDQLKRQAKELLRSTTAGDTAALARFRLLPAFRKLGDEPLRRTSPTRRPVLWGASRVVRLLPLVELLLQAGANPNDGVTLPLAAAAGDTATLELLVAHGADPNQPWASDGAATLYVVLHWATTPTVKAVHAPILPSSGVPPSATIPIATTVPSPR
jgi:hypothetical protein